ncbi:Hypothetical Protein FCC1311_021612 [Hondaea fermentalgiana]|uniref:Uncharacterized protein n=1 Tax=Hondaea fermentalgiana TaxID=2315210 RepID=A0A2R5GCP8_9STRA|nr:Hypothetical Protein FCC1311_021612 [Hondaea fermentalgiana]|eukprot:GBG25941.1 Hypothetical Protein FCC1311_021612 [Hondaea fermentalgiana]
MRRGLQSKSLNDLQELDGEETAKPLQSKRPLSRRWVAEAKPTLEAGLAAARHGLTAPQAGAKKPVRPTSMLEKFQYKLAEQVLQALQESINDSRVMEDLFYNISGTVPTRFAEKLNLDMERRWFYYELLATHYYMLERKHQPGMVKDLLLPLCAKLWSLEHFPAVFTLLFHRWMVETESGFTTKGWVMRFNVLLKGTYQLFWFDIEHDTRKLWPLFVRLREKMFEPTSLLFLDNPNASDQTELASYYVSAHAAKDSIRKDFSYVLARFYYYYSTRPERVQALCVNQLQLDDGLDSFVPQLVHQLRSIASRNEKVLIDYLKATALLPVDELELSSRNKLYSTLNELQMLGPPLHLSRPVVAEAARTMNKLFPQGQYIRLLINLLFTLLRPFHIFAFLFSSTSSSNKRRS